MLTAIFAIITSTRRPVEAGRDSSGMLWSRRNRTVLRIRPGRHSRCPVGWSLPAADSSRSRDSCENHSLQMRILMIAPEPFFEPRGTPFSEFHRIRALTALGHQVDLVTYPFGSDVSMPGLRVFRAMRPPFVRRAKIGPSLAKVPLDFSLTLTAIRRMMSGRYDAVHSHEEAGLIGVGLAAW